MLRIENLTFFYEGTHSTEVFKNFNFDSSCNGIVHLTGENGRGKTTLLRLISGLALPKEGKILWKNKPLQSEQVGFLSAQNNSSFFQLKGIEAINLYADLNDNKSYIHEKWWNTLKEHPPFQKALEQKYALCSTGMRQLINVATCLTKPSQVMLLDEPFKGLDSDAKKIFNELIEEISQDKLVIFTSHEEVALNRSKVKIHPLDNLRSEYA